MRKLIIGVLALQGDFQKHYQVISSLGYTAKEVRKPKDLEECQGLILPGGESTTMQRQMQFIGLDKSIEEFAQKSPVFGTCAGLILMSRQIPKISAYSLNLLDVEVERNAFGKQVESFQAPVEIYFESKQAQFLNAYFIRAPRIRHWQDTVQVLATYKNEPILVRQGHHLGSSFHPELTNNPIVHEYFIQLIKKS